MPKPSDIMATVAALMNDAAQDEYTNTAILPYFNLALNSLQELYELNNIPVTNATSAVIPIPAGIFEVGFDTTPALPSDLIEIQQLWESPSGQNAWTPVNKEEFIPHYLNNNTTISQFLIWSWQKQRIKLLAANADNDLKIDYTCSIFQKIVIGNVGVNLPFTNIQTFLEYKTAALVSMFLAENENRALALNGEAGDALSRALGIPVKGMQSIVTRRMPFRANFKRRGLSY